MTTRRQFLSMAAGSTAVVGLSSGIPHYLLAASRGPVARRTDRVLVVIQLSGGNDGINTVIPYADPEYYRNRFTLAVGRESVLKLNDECGLHPELEGLGELAEAGQLAVVNGVGYPQPNRSHFDSMDLWHTAHRQGERAVTGWLGRMFDAQAQTRNAEAARDPQGLHFGNEEQPLALASLDNPVPTLASLEDLRLKLANRQQLSALVSNTVGLPRASDNTLLQFVQSNARSALATSRRVEEILGVYRSDVRYPDSALGQKLKTVAQLIGSDLMTNVYYVTLDGFDTHSNQREAHDSLLRTVGDAVQAFHEDIRNQGNAERVLSFTFSEFGRRLRENASAGTDHGAAAPVFLAGGGVKTSGVFNGYPSLTDLDEGDLKFAVDYRQIYATLLENWFSTDSRALLGGSYETLNLV